MFHPIQISVKVIRGRKTKFLFFFFLQRKYFDHIDAIVVLWLLIQIDIGMTRL